jgi:glycosyltransferase involved in cell wall biosynthesis
LKAVARLRESLVRGRFPHTHLVVAGPDTVGHTAAARGFLEANGCADAGAFAGLLEGDMKQGALAAASVFVAPSYSEGFGISVLEAMAAGLPCVLTDGCNFTEAGAAEAARIVSTGDTDRFAAELLDLLNQPEAARIMGARARELVLGRYTWSAVAEEYERMVGRILSA